jgi:iron complex outermembrane receptor protein
MKHHKSGKSLFSRTLMKAAAAGAMLAGAASGVAAAQAPAADASGDIVVTGSRVRGVAPVGSAIVSISRSDVESSGAVTTTQLIQQVPQVFNLGISESSRGQSGGSNNITYGTTINLRGIGPFTTLVLVDGHRAVPQGTTGFAVDPSIIPTLALSRVEIVADGSSAIYGSDAIAGVVNLILRRDFEGIQATSRFAIGDNYDESQLGVIVGKKWDSGRFTLAVENGYHSALSGKDRDFFRGDLRAKGGGDFRVTNCAPGTITVSGVAYPIPAGGVAAGSSSALVAGAANRCDNLQIADLIPLQDRNSLATTFEQNFGDRLQIFGDGFASKRTFKIYNGAANSSITVPSTNAFFAWPSAIAKPASETVGYSFINDYPQGYSDGFSKAFELTLGARYKLPANWNFETSYTAGRNDDRSVSHNVANAAALTAALASANPATAFNPFGGPNSASVINNILIGYSKANGRTTLKFYEAKLDGPLFALPGGEVKGVVGYEGQDFHVVQVNYAGTVFAVTSTISNRTRKVDSYYGELLIPIVGEGNAVPGIHSLNLDVAGRYDEYSDVGITRNPKIGLDWSPVEDLKLRASYGTSFRAPTISQIYGNTNSLFVQNYSDPTIGGAIRQGVARSGANLTLSPETAKSWSYGFDLTPKMLPGAKLSVTYFKVDYENQVVAYLSDLAILSKEAQLAGTNIIVRNPSAALIAQQLAETGFTGVLPSPVTLFVEGRNSNLAKTIAEGVDFQASYRFGTESMGDFNLGLNGTYFTNYKTAISVSAPLLDQLNTIFNPLKFKTRGSVSWNKGPALANLFVNYLNGYDNITATPVQKVASYTTVDARVGWQFGETHPFTVALDVRNLFDEDPPFVNIAQSANGGGGFDPTLTNPVGRLIGISLDAKF